MDFFLKYRYQSIAVWLIMAWSRQCEYLHVELS